MPGTANWPFEIPDPPTNASTDWWLEPSSWVECDVFPRNQYGEVKGEPYYDPE